MYFQCQHVLQVSLGEKGALLLSSFGAATYILAHFLLTSCRMQGIRKCPFGTTSVRTAPLVKRDELYMPGPAHYHQQSQSQGEQGGGEEGKGANSKPQRLSHTFASTSKRLYSPPSIVTVSLHNTPFIMIIMTTFCITLMINFNPLNIMTMFCNK